MKIYMVSQGEYSDYSVLGLYTTREAADEHAALLNKARVYGDEASVEEWEADARNRNVLVYGVNAFPARDENELRKGPTVIDRNPFPQVMAEVPPPHVWLPRYAKHPEGQAYGLSYEAAEKALHDALAKFKAEQLDAVRAQLVK